MKHMGDNSFDEGDTKPKKTMLKSTQRLRKKRVKRCKELTDSLNSLRSEKNIRIPSISQFLSVNVLPAETNKIRRFFKGESTEMPKYNRNVISTRSEKKRDESF
jgi:hypothetical protein